MAKINGTNSDANIVQSEAAPPAGKKKDDVSVPLDANLSTPAAKPVPPPAPLPLDFNLTEAGDGPETINAAVFEQFYLQPAGTGFIDSFVRVQSPGNDTNEEGYNTDNRPLQFDENSSPNFTRSLLLADVPTVTVDSVVYREFLLDINEPNNKGEGLLSLDALQIYLADSPALHTFTGSPTATGNFSGGSSQLVYDMDGAGNTSLALNADLSHGSGQSDIRVLIPDELFDAAGLPYVYLYSAFGFEGGAYEADGGFEEWAVGPVVQAPAVAVTFAVTVASEAPGNDTPNGLAVIVEELTADDTGTFTITKGGSALTGTNTAAVTITVSGTGEDGDFTLVDGTPLDYSAIVAAVAAAADTALGAGSAVVLGDTITVTWGAGDPDFFTVDLTAFNDDLTDSPENIVLTLSGPTVVEGSASLVAGDESAQLTITDIDVAVAFAVTVASEATGNDTPNGLAVIAEELTADDTGTFTITKGGSALTGTNTAAVAITVSGTGEDGDFTIVDGTPLDFTAIVAAINTAATAASLAVSGVTATSLTVTWDSTDGAAFSVNLTAFNDDLFDSPENIVLTLSGPTVVEGSASLVAGDESAQLNITDNDVAVTFAITVASEDPVGPPADASATIVEQLAGDDRATFTITKGGGVLTGTNTAAVTLTMSGTAVDADFTTAVISTVATAAGVAGIGVSAQDADSVVLTWGAGDPDFFTVDLTAFNDDLLDNGDALTLTLSAATIVEGTASITTPAATATILDNDVAVEFAITVASEDPVNPVPDASATIVEQVPTDDRATFTITKGSALLTGTNTAAVTLTMSGTAVDADFTTAVISTVATAATGAGIGVSAQDADSVVLTWGAGDPDFFTVNLTAFNDDLLDNGDALTLTLSAASIVEGTASILTPAATATILDNDVAVEFAITVASEDPVGPPADASATIVEQVASDDTATFTITKGAGVLTGTNTAAVTLTMSGTAVDADFTTAVISTVATAAGGAGIGVSAQDADSVVLTWGAGDPDFFTVNLTAFNDDLLDNGDALTLTLSAASIVEGTASILTPAATATILDNDAAVNFAITVASEDPVGPPADASATIVEQVASDDTATFTITKGAGVLTGTNTAAVTLTMSGTAVDADFTTAVISTVATAATGAGIGVSAQDADSVVLTWGAGDPDFFTVNLTAFNDDLLDNGDALTLTLSAASIVEGTASILTPAATATILDNDAAVNFAITVASEDPVGPPADASATIVEQVASDDTATFTITKGAGVLTGTNTAAVTLTMSGTAVDADFTTAVISTVATAATGAGIGVSAQDADSVVLTWGAGDPDFFTVNLTAFNDDLLDNGDALTLTLSAASIVEGTASILTPAATATILDNDAAVTFAVTAASEATGNDVPNGFAVIAEELTTDDTGTFTITKSGGVLTGTNTAAVTITVSGTGADDDFTGMAGADVADIVAAINAAATAASLAVSGVTADSLTVTWDSTDVAAFSVNLTAFNEDLTDSPENIVLTLSGPTVVEGSASLVAGDESAQLTITDIDVAVAFAVTVASEATGNDTPNGLAVIAEELTTDDTGTFTITKGGGALTGANTAAVTITVSGNAEDDDFIGMAGTDVADIVAAINAAATAASLTVSGVTATSLTVTWGVGDPVSFNVALTAFNDALVDIPNPENINLTLSSQTVDEGSASITSPTAQLTITDTDAFVPVVLDLDGDGLEFVAMGDASNQALFDFNGDGTKETAAWVGADDGFLAYDQNNDRLVNDGSQIAFADMTAEADTDLEALKAVFDSNHDGLLTEADEQFSRFGVWQDANGNGSTEAGEFKTLAEMGIVSLGLTSDGRSYSAANGQVTVHGEASFTYQDGSHGVLGDVSLAIGGAAESSGDSLVGGAGNETLFGGSGNDRYEFAQGGGQDTVVDSGGSADIMAFSAGVNPLDLVLSRQANDLRIAVYGSADQVTVQNWFGGAGNQVETIQAGNGQTLLSSQVNQLIEAMAGFTADNNGMAWDQGIVAKPEEVGAIVAASWQ